jgi:hypothetical protein
MRWEGHEMPTGGEEECINVIGGKATRKETIRKNKM